MALEFQIEEDLIKAEPLSPIDLVYRAVADSPTRLSTIKDIARRTGIDDLEVTLLVGMLVPNHIRVSKIVTKNGSRLYALAERKASWRESMAGVGLRLFSIKSCDL